MPVTPHRLNAEALDILFAVALGEGFIAGMYEYKGRIVSGEIFTVTEYGQGLSRILLGFLIIILSWLHYRRSTMTGRAYPAGEFVVDVLVVVSYMTLFLFVDAPAAYYTTIAVIWLFYGLARIAEYRPGFAYLMFSVVFFSFFALAAVSTWLTDGTTAEWIRFSVVTVAIILYRPIDRKLSLRREVTA